MRVESLKRIKGLPQRRRSTLDLVTQWMCAPGYSSRNDDWQGPFGAFRSQRRSTGAKNSEEVVEQDESHSMREEDRQSNVSAQFSSVGSYFSIKKEVRVDAETGAYTEFERVEVNTEENDSGLTSEEAGEEILEDMGEAGNHAIDPSHLSVGSLENLLGEVNAFVTAARYSQPEPRKGHENVKSKESHVFAFSDRQKVAAKPIVGFKNLYTGERVRMCIYCYMMASHNGHLASDTPVDFRCRCRVVPPNKRRVTQKIVPQCLRGVNHKCLMRGLGTRWGMIEWKVLVLTPLRQAYHRGQLGPFLKAVVLLPFMINQGKQEIPSDVWKMLESMGVASTINELYLFLCFDMKNVSSYNIHEMDSDLAHEVRKAYHIRVMENLRNDIGTDF